MSEKFARWLVGMSFGFIRRLVAYFVLAWLEKFDYYLVKKDEEPIEGYVYLDEEQALSEYAGAMA